MSGYRKSIANFTLTVGGVIVTKGGGEGEYFSATAPERGGGKSGVHGDFVLYDMPGGLYEVTVTFLETSEENSRMQTLYNAQANHEFLGTYDFSAEDVGTNESFSGQALFKKEPDRGKGAEAGNYQWQLIVGSETPWEYAERTVSI